MSAGSFISNIDSCSKTTVSNWKVGIDKGKYGPMEEDLFAEMCTRKNGVTAMEAFDITKDGARKAKRATDEKKNKKWKLRGHRHYFLLELQNWKDSLRCTAGLQE